MLNEAQPRVKRGSGRGSSWVNYDFPGPIRMQITKAGNKWQAWLSKLPSGPGTHVFDLAGLSKIDAEKIKDEIIHSYTFGNNILKTGKQIQSKYSKYKRENESVDEALPLNEFDDYGLESIADRAEQLGKLLRGFAHDVSQDLDRDENRLVGKALKNYNAFFNSFKTMYKKIV